MYTTYERFKFPVTFEGDDAHWSCVELALSTPWLLVMTVKTGSAPRTLFLHGIDQLAALARGSELGNLSRAYVVLPPAAASADWTFVRVHRIEAEPEPRTADYDRLLLTASDGTHYAGFPIAPTEHRHGPLLLIADLSMPDLHQPARIDEAARALVLAGRC